MKKRIVLMVSALVLACGLSACAGGKDAVDSSSGAPVSGSVSTQSSTGDSVGSSEENADPETGSGTQGEDSEPETGNFQGLQVEDEGEIDIQDGQDIVID